MTRKWRGSTYEIHVSNPEGVEKGVRAITVDGKEVEVLPVLPAGSVCRADGKVRLCNDQVRNRRLACRDRR